MAGNRKSLFKGRSEHSNTRNRLFGVCHFRDCTAQVCARALLELRAASSPSQGRAIGLVPCAIGGASLAEWQKSYQGGRDTIDVHQCCSPYNSKKKPRQTQIRYPYVSTDLLVIFRGQPIPFRSPVLAMEIISSCISPEHPKKV